MYLWENPVLQRELLINLRMERGFVLMFVYQAVLAALVFFAWPQSDHVDLSQQSDGAQQLVNMFFIGQYLLASLMAPSFAAGAISGEKERRTYEMLLASPLRPGAIVAGKLLASLAHLAILIFSSLPIVMLCLPLGGVSIYEVLAAYLGLIASVVTFGTIGVACSSYFHRTVASLVVSYLLVLPLALAGALLWIAAARWGQTRLILMVTVVPGVAAVICTVLFAQTSARLLHPPDVGSEGKEVVDLETEAKHVVGLVIQRDQFPDRLFAPAKRKTLMEDSVNPVYDKEIRSELFSQGTLMLRVVIQISILLAVLLMAPCLYVWPRYVAWYVAYVIVFNMLVGPVFSAGSITNERERQTLDLLLTTAISPWQILSGKLRAGLRISCVLTLFLMWPLFLAAAMISDYWNNLLAVVAFLGIILVTCMTTGIVALFCSVVFRRTAISLIISYLVIILLFFGPVAATTFVSVFHPDLRRSPAIRLLCSASPIVAAFSVPLTGEMKAAALDSGNEQNEADRQNNTAWLAFLVMGPIANGFLLTAMVWLFNKRWRVTSQQAQPGVT